MSESNNHHFNTKLNDWIQYIDKIKKKVSWKKNLQKAQEKLRRTIPERITFQCMDQLLSYPIVQIEKIESISSTKCYLRRYSCIEDNESTTVDSFSSLEETDLENEQMERKMGNRIEMIFLDDDEENEDFIELDKEKGHRSLVNSEIGRSTPSTEKYFVEKKEFENECKNYSSKKCPKCSVNPSKSKRGVDILELEEQIKKFKEELRLVEKSKSTKKKKLSSPSTINDCSLFEENNSSTDSVNLAKNEVDMLEKRCDNTSNATMLPNNQRLNLNVDKNIHEEVDCSAEKNCNSRTTVMSPDFTVTNTSTRINEISLTKTNIAQTLDHQSSCQAATGNFTSTSIASAPTAMLNLTAPSSSEAVLTTWLVPTLLPLNTESQIPVLALVSIVPEPASAVSSLPTQSQSSQSLLATPEAESNSQSGFTTTGSIPVSTAPISMSSAQGLMPTVPLPPIMTTIKPNSMSISIMEQHLSTTIGRTPPPYPSPPSYSGVHYLQINPNLPMHKPNVPSQQKNTIHSIDILNNIVQCIMRIRESKITWRTAFRNIDMNKIFIILKAAMNHMQQLAAYLNIASWRVLINKIAVYSQNPEVCNEPISKDEIYEIIYFYIECIRKKMMRLQAQNQKQIRSAVHPAPKSTRYLSPQTTDTFCPNVFSPNSTLQGTPGHGFFDQQRRFPAPVPFPSHTLPSCSQGSYAASNYCGSNPQGLSHSLLSYLLKNTQTNQLNTLANNAVMTNEQKLTLYCQLTIYDQLVKRTNHLITKQPTLLAQKVQIDISSQIESCKQQQVDVILNKNKKREKIVESIDIARMKRNVPGILKRKVENGTYLDEYGQGTYKKVLCQGKELNDKESQFQEHAIIQDSNSLTDKYVVEEIKCTPQFVTNNVLEIIPTITNVASIPSNAFDKIE